MDAVGIGFGAIVGAGIFVVTGVAAGAAGSAFVLGLIVGWDCGHRQRAFLRPACGAVSPVTAGWMFLASKISAAGTVGSLLAISLSPTTMVTSLMVLAVGLGARWLSRPSSP